MTSFPNRRVLRYHEREGPGGALASRWAPVAFGIVTALVIWYVWGSLRQLPIWDDEIAYLFQAKLFAHGRWTAPSPPLPEFFEQSYVLVRPAFAAKYPPGNSLALAPGVLVGLPGLSVIILSGITGGLVFALARSIGGPGVGLLAWLVWVGTPDNLRYHASYLSETVTTAAWLVGWWALLRWRRDGGWLWLAVVAGATSWGAITRPLTTVAWSLPVLAIVLADAWRTRAWRELGVALAVGAAILAVIPLWSARTTGDWRTTPLTLYTDTYLPWDRVGFATEIPPSKRPIPPDLVPLDRTFRALHADYQVRRLPTVLLERAFLVGYNEWRGWRIVLLPCALLALATLPALGWVAVGTAVSLLLIYLTYAHVPTWTVYYVEMQPALAFLTAWGLWRIVGATRWRGALMGAVTLALVLDLAVQAAHWRRLLDGTHTHQRALEAVLARAPASPKIIFIRYAPDHQSNYSLVANEPLLDGAPTWLVHDRGSENPRLLAIAPGRIGFLYDEATRTLSPVGGFTQALR